MADLTNFPSTDDLNRRLAQRIITELQKGITSKGKASLVVSGGKTPLGLFKLLSQQPLEWDKVTITLADERWVDCHDEASNEKLVRENLIQDQAATAQFVSLKNDSLTPFDGAAGIEKSLKDIVKPFDVVILGMGDDGHTASLFPGAENLFPALDMKSKKLCMGMTPLTAPLDRLTLTLPALLNSRQIFLHLVGENKRVVYHQAQEGNDVNEMPVRAIIHQTQTPVDVFWSA
ncbi:6-phosphogluconolactonase [Pragia fontium]|uniref:6-phosphogluconolactonase n=2 Tax=Pragia fontium TaxID=82985 RepID=A0AAJ4WAJ6_9GAMM|nr:6-phosphogluconolactonase [Pragia fontium]GKX61536.1 6-phosphogluconolactonase [Pragia fontium]SFC80384.1 6-phosphogluconolactonase [Pragia fontium DSM 5563 = ATCC 49100]SUB82661.1 6-phosphogluconolactonase [Pragia fontium]